MAIRIPPNLMPHTADIEPYIGAGATGPVYGPAVTVRCLREDTRRLVRNPSGGEAVSSTTLWCPPGTAAPVDSRVTIGGRAATVITTTNHDGGSLPVPSHVEVHLT